MCSKVVMVSALGVIETGADVVKTIYMILMFMERWGTAADCGGYSLINSGSGRTQLKGLKK